MNHQPYNGWYNYETWSVNLWLGESRYDQDRIQELTNEARSVYDLAQSLKEWIEEDNPLAGQANLYEQLLGGAISEVNWTELAEHYWEDFKKDDEEEEEEEDEEE